MKIYFGRIFVRFKSYFYISKVAYTLSNIENMKYQNIREEELKNKLAHEYFPIFDCTKINGNVDFCVCIKQSTKELFEQESLVVG